MLSPRLPARRRAPLIAYRDNLEDEASAPIVDLQVSKLVCYQKRQMQVEAHPALKLTPCLSPSQGLRWR